MLIRSTRIICALTLLLARPVTAQTGGTQAGASRTGASASAGGSAAAQVNVLNSKKFNVYKSDIKGEVVKDGIKGVSVLFSCEYNFTDTEYAQMANRARQNYFTFWVTILDKNNEPVYDANQYVNYKRNQNVANHFATTLAFGSQVKTAKPEPRRSTGVELFIPYAQLNLPEGPNNVKVMFSAYAGNSDAPGKRFDNLSLQTTSITKPATYWVKLTPKQIAVTDKSGKKTEVSQIAEDFAVGRGNDKAFADVLTTGSGIVGKPISFVYSEGDLMQIRTQRESRTTGQLAYRQRPVTGTNGQPVAGFENGNILVDGPLDLKGATASLKTSALEATFAVEKSKLPAVRFAGFKVNRFTKFEGTTGASFTFNYEASVPKNLPDLLAVPSYSTSDDEKGSFVPLLGGKVMSGNAKVDSTGAVNVGHTPSGTVEVFFPYASFLLSDEASRKNGPKRFRLEVQLQGSTSNLTQKFARQTLDVNALKDATVDFATVKPEEVHNQMRGMIISIPYKIPAIYAEQLKGNFVIQFNETVAQNEESRFMGFLRKTTLLDKDIKRIPTPGDKTGSATYLVSQPSGTINLFMPYTSLALTENASPMKFTAKISMNQPGNTGAPTPASLELGTTNTSLKLNLDEKKLRFLTVSVSGIRMKDAGGNILWRIRSADGPIYQSPLIPAEKKMENFYAHNYCASEDDKIIIEVLKGSDANNLKEIARWESPVKNLKPGETLELIPEGSSPDGNVRNVAITYKIN